MSVFIVEAKMAAKSLSDYVVAVRREIGYLHDDIKNHSVFAYFIAAVLAFIVALVVAFL